MPSALKLLNPQEIKFLTHYAESGNASEAARKAGYSEKNAGNTASLLLKRKHITAALDELKEQLIDELITTRRRVLQRVSWMAFADPGELFTENGVLRPMKDIPPELRACIAGIEIEDRSGEDDFVTVVKIKLVDRTKPLDQLMRHFGLYEIDNKQKGPVVLKVGYDTGDEDA